MWTLSGIEVNEGTFLHNCWSVWAKPGAGLACRWLLSLLGRAISCLGRPATAVLMPGPLPAWLGRERDWAVSAAPRLGHCLPVGRPLG